MGAALDLGCDATRDVPDHALDLSNTWQYRVACPRERHCDVDRLPAMEGSTVRPSLAFYNTFAAIDALLAAVRTADSLWGTPKRKDVREPKRGWRGSPCRDRQFATARVKSSGQEPRQ
jgi:hypothetical protein